MSGGHFNYDQNRIKYIADEIERIIRKEPDDFGHVYEFDDDIIEEFKVGVKLLRQAKIYAHCIDYLLSSDTGPESFREHLRRDLQAMGVDHE